MKKFFKAIMTLHRVSGLRPPVTKRGVICRIGAAVVQEPKCTSYAVKRMLEVRSVPAYQSREPAEPHSRDCNLWGARPCSNHGRVSPFALLTGI